MREVRVIPDREKGRESKGFGYVELEDRESCKKALALSASILIFLSDGLLQNEECNIRWTSKHVVKGDFWPSLGSGCSQVVGCIASDRTVATRELVEAI